MKAPQTCGKSLSDVFATQGHHRQQVTTGRALLVFSMLSVPSKRTSAFGIQLRAGENIPQKRVLA